ncbi:MAG TPA: LpqB family beta-propeller domain-containing protein [Pseudonocardiaceae bacterium]
MLALIAATAAAGVVAAAGGCAAIPESSPVEVVGPQVSETSEAPVPPPPAGLDPLSVVRGFIEASASQANRHAAARAYLTDQAKASWNDTGPVVVLADTFNTVYNTSPGDAQTEDYRQVLLRGQQLGQLGADGSFTANRSAINPTMDLVKQNGEWRIATPPEALHVLYGEFRTSYRSIGVRFVDPSRNTLVTDRRWVLAQPSSGWPSRAVDLLLGGPSAAVRDAVVNELNGAKIRTNVVLGENDVLTVDLTRVPELSDMQRRLAAAQIVGSLSEVVVQKIRIQVDGVPLVPNKPDWVAADALPFTPDDWVKPDLPPLAVDNHRVVRVEGGTPMAGPAGDGSLPVESAAQSADGTLLAVVATDGGRPRLVVGPIADPKPVTLQAASMTRPTWRRGTTPEVWTVINGGTGVGVLSTGDRGLVTFGVDLSDLAVKGRITELRLSRDGVRVAAVVDGALYVAIVVGSEDGTRVRNPRLLIGPGAAQIADVDWKGRDKVVVATRGKDNPQVYEVTVDGLNWMAYENTNLTGPLSGIAAAVGRPVLVADQGGLWFARDTNELWYSEGLSHGTDPFYPG